MAQMQQRGLAFKLMNPKAIVDVLTAIGVHPTVTCENIQKPTTETVAAMYQALAEFCFDLDIQQVKGRGCDVPSVGQFVEIFDEALDVLTTFKLARQLALINHVEDFSMKDIWDPQAKRLRAILSGMINFCRYKESQTGVIETMKEEVQTRDNVRLELVLKFNAVSDELTTAQGNHSAELQEVLDAENALRDSQDEVDKLQKQKQTADRKAEQAEAQKQGATEKLTQTEQRTEQLRDHLASLQEQVAESPEALQMELQELQAAIRSQKAKVEEKGDHKRSRVQRVQALRSAKNQIENYEAKIGRVTEAAQIQAAASDCTSATRAELANMQVVFDACRAEELDLRQALDQMSQDMEAAKQAHEEQERQCDEQRRQTLARHEELLEKRSDEERQFDALEAERMRLESEIANVTRAFEAERLDHQDKLKQIQEQADEYTQTVGGLVNHYIAEVGRTSCKASPLASPESASAQKRGLRSPGLRIGASPSPRRLCP